MDNHRKPDPTLTPRLLRRADVERVTGLSTSSIYRMMRSGDFPRPVQLTRGSVGWRFSEIDAWIEARPRSAI